MEKKTSWLDRLMLAITFAEANEHETARTYLQNKSQSDSRKYKCITGECALPRDLHSSQRTT